MGQPDAYASANIGELGAKPEWLTFDCYGTLIQWDEGLLAAVERIALKRPGGALDAAALIAAYDRHEHELEKGRPHMSFRRWQAKACGARWPNWALPTSTATSRS